MGGGCKTVGVPPSACAKGFESDGEGGCRAILPSSPPSGCGVGTFAVPGETSCHDVAPCGPAPYGDVPTGAPILYVDGSYAGGASDGSSGKPFTKINDAIAAASTTSTTIVAVAAGTYEEDVAIDRPVQLFGRCPSMVEVRGALLPVHDVARSGIGAFFGSEMTNRSTLVEKATYFGIAVYRDPTTLAESSLTVKSSLFERNIQAGIIGVGVTIDVQSSVVRDQKPLSDGKYGVGIWVDHFPGKPLLCSALRLSTSVVTGNTTFGVLVQDSEATIETTTVRDNKARPADGNFGRGIGVQHVSKTAPAKIVVRDSLVASNVETGVDVIADATATIERTIVRGTIAHAFAGAGVYSTPIVPTRPDGAIGPLPTLTIVDSRLEKNDVTGVASRGVLQMSGCMVVGNHTQGIIQHGGSATIDTTVVRDTQPHPMDLSDGHGIFFTTEVIRTPPIRAPVDATLTDVLVERALKAGIASISGTLGLERVAVRDTMPEKSTGNVGLGVYSVAELAGDAPTLSMRSVVVDGNYAGGVLSYGTTTTIDACVLRTRGPTSAAAKSPPNASR